MAVLKLVPQAAPQVERSPRPYRTFYYDRGARESDWSHRGAASSLQGAVIAATRQIMQRRAASAVIYGVAGHAVCRIKKVGGSISTVGYFEATEESTQ